MSFSNKIQHTLYIDNINYTYIWYVSLNYVSYGSYCTFHIIQKLLQKLNTLRWSTTSCCFSSWDQSPKTVHDLGTVDEFPLNKKTHIPSKGGRRKIIDPNMPKPRDPRICWRFAKGEIPIEDSDSNPCQTFLFGKKTCSPIFLVGGVTPSFISDHFQSFPECYTVFV